MRVVAQTGVSAVSVGQQSLNLDKTETETGFVVTNPSPHPSQTTDTCRRGKFVNLHKSTMAVQNKMFCQHS